MPAEQYSPWPQEHYSTGYAGASCGGMPDAGRAQDRTAASASMCLISAKGSQKEKRCQAGKRGRQCMPRRYLNLRRFATGGKFRMLKTVRRRRRCALTRR